MVVPICRELRAELGLPDFNVEPVTDMEIELVLGASARVFYLGIRKFVYAVPVRFDINVLIEAEVNLFFDGIANVHSALHKNLGTRKVRGKSKTPVKSKVTGKEPRAVDFSRT
jgi:hypothetical protein